MDYVNGAAALAHCCLIYSLLMWHASCFCAWPFVTDLPASNYSWTLPVLTAACLWNQSLPPATVYLICPSLADTSLFPDYPSSAHTWSDHLLPLWPCCLPPLARQVPADWSPSSKSLTSSPIPVTCYLSSACLLAAFQFSVCCRLPATGQWIFILHWPSCQLYHAQPLPADPTSHLRGHASYPPALTIGRTLSQSCKRDLLHVRLYHQVNNWSGQEGGKGIAIMRWLH